MPELREEPRRSSPARRSWALGVALALHLLSGGWLIGSKGVGPYFYDERFTLENVRRIYLQGHPVPTSYFWYAPLSYVPQAATLLAIDRVGRAFDSPALKTFEPTGEVTKRGVRIARWFGILYGCLTLVALHAIARRLWDARAADFAVIALGASPWFTRGNAEFKPDALVVLLVVTGFLPLVRYVLDGAPRDRRLAALAAGAATAAKLNGALCVVPLGLACLFETSWRRRLRATLESAAITLGSFLLLNPFPASALYYLGRVDSQWQDRAQDLGFLAMLGTMTGKLFKITYFGPLFGVAAVLGLILVARSLRAREESSRRLLGHALWLVYPLVYLVFLCATTRYPKENNLLPALPFAAALAGVGLAAAAARIAHRRTALARALLPAAALVGALALARYVAVETIEQGADRQVREIRRLLRGGNGRVVAWWGDEESAIDFVNSGWKGPPPTLVQVDAALAADGERLGRFDCAGGHGPPPAELAAALAARFPLAVVDAGPLLGSRLVQRTPRPWYGCRPWHQRGGSIALSFEALSDGWFEARLPAALPAHDAVTFNGRIRQQELPVEAEVSARPLELLPGPVRRSWQRLSTERLPGDLAGAALRVRSLSGEPPELELLLWARPDGSPTPAEELSSPNDGEESG